MTSSAPIVQPHPPVLWRDILLVIAAVIFVRAPFLDQAVQGDDVYYLYGAMHAQIDPLHPLDTTYAFQGAEVSMRGHPHGPVNSWILGALLAIAGDVYELPFHAAYIIFGLLAAVSMLTLAARFSPEPLLATLLFIVVPPFVVNGTSFEADLPFLAFWMSALALFVRAVDRHSGLLLTLSILCSAIATLTAYQAILLIPIQAVYLWINHRRWAFGWISLTTPILAVAGWQLWELTSGGELPASVLAGYLDPLQVLTQKVRSAIALVVHSGWIVAPPLMLLALGRPFRLARVSWIVATVAGAVALFYDPNPLFWGSVFCGAFLVSYALERTLTTNSSDIRWLTAWIAIFFAGAVVLFFAGSARYLLPLAAPVAILVARSTRPLWLQLGIAANLFLALGMAHANYQHWNDTRLFAARVIREAGPGPQGPRRVWANAEFGLRYYLEAAGALPILRDQPLTAGDLIVTSELVGAVNVDAPTSELRTHDVSPVIPLRLISIQGGSGYSTASQGLLPFTLSRGPVDRLIAELVVARQPTFSYLEPTTPEAADQIVAGLYPDGWTTNQAIVVVKPPEPTVENAQLMANIYISPDTPARHIELFADGQPIASETFDTPGAYTLSGPFATTGDVVTLMLTTDATYRAAGDVRELGVVITGIGFAPQQ